MWRKRERYIYIYGVPRRRRYFEFSAVGDCLYPNIYGPRDKVVLISLLLNIGRASNLGGCFGPEIKFCDGWLLRTSVASLKQNRAMARPT